jgi:AP-4 complex subunit mu-1
VFSEPIEVHKRDVLQQAARWGSRMLNRKTVSSHETDRPIALSVKKEKKRKNEIFVDLLERVTVLFGRTGEVIKSEVDGAIVMKSYLKGEPVLHLALNEDLLIGDGDGSQRYGVRVEDMNFLHEVGAQEFERTRELVFAAPQGEFTVLNYRVSDCAKLPFRVFPFLEAGRSERSLELSLKVRADFPPENVATTVEVCVPLPPTTSSVGTEHSGYGVPGVSTDFLKSKHTLVWTIEQFQGGSERQLRLHITLDEARTPITMHQVGPISVDFDLPMFACSGVNIRSFRVTERDPRYNPARWIRYVTRSRSYVARVGL